MRLFSKAQKIKILKSSIFSPPPSPFFNASEYKEDVIVVSEFTGVLRQLIETQTKYLPLGKSISSSSRFSSDEWPLGSSSQASDRNSPGEPENQEQIFIDSASISGLPCYQISEGQIPDISEENVVSILIGLYFLFSLCESYNSVELQWQEI